MNIFNRLISTGDDASHKRFNSLVAMGLFVVVVIAALYYITVPDVYIYGLVAIVLGNSALAVAGARKSNTGQMSSNTSQMNLNEGCIDQEFEDKEE